MFAFAVLIVGLAQAVPALRSDSTLFGGRFYPRVVTGTDSTQAYALFLPPNYGNDHRWPILFLMDPRGRALVPLTRFAPAAARLGYVVMSSYNTISDGPTEPNVAALNGMMADAQRVLAIDPHRFYLGGFSGTARMAWPFAAQLKGAVRGIVSVGAGTPQGGGKWLEPFAKSNDIAIFSAAGGFDFNRDEVARLDEQLEAHRIRHRTVIFKGGHEWVPESVAMDALEWLTIEAAADPGHGDGNLTSTYLAARLAEIDTIAQEGDTSEAFRRLSSLGRELGSHPLLADYRKRSQGAALLARGEDAVREDRQRIRGDSAWRDLARNELHRALTAEPRGPADELADVLRLTELKALTRETVPMTVRASATRRLEWLYVTTAYYDARDYLESKSYGLALFVLDVGHRIHELSSPSCELAVTALAGLGQGSAAARYPECAVRP
ncbi:MAG: hypothetical protein ABI647_16870 [Gemmatimonadota bacterium]